MRDLLIVEDGPAVELRESPAQGTRHAVGFGVIIATGEPVAVKIEGGLGGLARERMALTCLGGTARPVPRLLAAGAATLGTQKISCLVMERRSGAPPTSTAGWRRMGRAYARLADLGEMPACMPVLDRVTFGAEHARRIRELGGLLGELIASVPDWQRVSSDAVPGAPPLVITHGDPGPGNFLDDGGEGSIVDWEEAQVAPRGLDLARLMFIAMLGAGPSGYAARDHRERAGAVTGAYLEALSEAWQPTREEWRWWVTAAGIQFIHRRWQLDGRPAPWQDAAEVLRAALSCQPRPT
jgi:aminoglycoside phosphotransferase (APT) family kinase protein